MPDTDFNIINSEIKTLFECISKKSLLEGTPLLLSKICYRRKLISTIKCHIDGQFDHLDNHFGV